MTLRRNLNYFLCKILYWTRVAATAHACLSLKCRIRGRKSYFRVSQNESKTKNIFPHLMIHFVVYLIDFEKGLTVLCTQKREAPKVVGGGLCADKDMPSI